MITEPINLCRACGRIRGELSDLCGSCLYAKLFPDGDPIADRYHMEDTVKQGDRERMDSVRDSFRKDP